jgi:hypothetical protein
MLRTAMGPAITALLEDLVVEEMLSPDGATILTVLGVFGTQVTACC